MALLGFFPSVSAGPERGEFEEFTAAAVSRALADAPSGDVLVCLPGVAEIRDVQHVRVVEQKVSWLCSISKRARPNATTTLLDTDLCCS
jgi:HrpA-like RNA helicase